MNNQIGGIIFVVMGIIFMVFHRKIVRGTIEFAEEHHLSHGSEIIGRIGFVVVGLFFLIFGLFMLLS